MRRLETKDLRLVNKIHPISSIQHLESRIGFFQLSKLAQLLKLSPRTPTFHFLLPTAYCLLLTSRAIATATATYPF